MGHCERIFHRPVFFTALLSITALTSFGSSGVFSAGILTTLQRDFKFKSSEVGLLLTVHDIVALVLVTPLAYIGAKRHRPRILGALTLVCALGCLCSAIPQFIGGGSYDSSISSTANTSNSTGQAAPETPPSTSHRGGNSAQVCVPDISPDDGISDTVCSAAEQAASGVQYHRAVWLYVGQALFGIGGAGYFPLGISYIDDGVSKSSSSLHVAVIFGLCSLTPIFAFSLSGVVLSYHKNFYKIDVDDLGYGDNDPRWIGAWWLGYLIYTGILIVISIPFFFFPKVWPHKNEAIEEQTNMSAKLKSGNHSSSVSLMKDTIPKIGSSVFGIIKGYLWTMSRLMTNLTYVAVISAVCSEIAIAAGFFSFVGRYIQTEYDVSPSTTSIILGCVSSPTLFFGNLLGGLIVKKMKLGMRGMVIMAMLVTLAVFIITPLNFAVGCEKTAISGVTVPYPGNKETNLATQCIFDCGCTSGTYAPVCGSDGLTYITPCHAGCSEELVVGDATLDETTHIFTGCSCTGSNASSNQYSGNNVLVSEFTAVQEACPRDCSSKLIAFIVIFGVSGLISAMIKNPSFMLELRCVDEEDRAISLALGSLLIRVLGFVPAPIYFGAAIQTTCLMFQESCGKTGNCLIFDSNKLRKVVFGLVLVLKGASLLCYFISFASMRRGEDGIYHQMQLCKPKSSSGKSDDV